LFALLFDWNIHWSSLRENRELKDSEHIFFVAMKHGGFHRRTLKTKLMNVKKGRIKNNKNNTHPQFANPIQPKKLVRKKKWCDFKAKGSTSSERLVGAQTRVHGI
jgi:hypothetical protein